MNFNENEYPVGFEVTVKDLLKGSIPPTFDNKPSITLRIPPYQRPYRWTQDSVKKLFTDIQSSSLNKKIANYHLGTMIVNKKSIDTYDIVDGQQRYVTLWLIKRLYEEQKQKSDNEIGPSENQCLDLGGKIEFNEESQYNIMNNLRLIKSIFKDNKDVLNLEIEFLFNQCIIQLIIVDNEDDAFKFFNSQNSKGKQLYPHDVLKSFHLRALQQLPYVSTNKVNSRELIRKWEKYYSVPYYFQNFFQALFDIRLWAKGRQTCEFTMKYIDEFKGPENVCELKEANVDLDDLNFYQFQKASIILELFFSNNKSSEDHEINSIGFTSKNAGKELKITYPYQLTQNIVNGYRFFDMVEHYARKLPKEVFDYVKRFDDSSDTDEDPQNPTELLKKTHQRLDKITSERPDYFFRSRRLFDLAVLFYIDRFRLEEINTNIINILLAFSFNSRFKYLRMTDQHINNTAISEYFGMNYYGKSVTVMKGLFPLIENSTSPQSFKESIDTVVLFNQEQEESDMPYSRELVQKIKNLIE
ncbi:MAG: DUF262 domain-containing protein [Bacteroidales bacterium]|jgi:uncharacterized protein with ParB-like and HNH nuclease domain|nr:DUF262 domain-containing protein [Bacteroidales bacterium]